MLTGKGLAATAAAGSGCVCKASVRAINSPCLETPPITFLTVGKPEKIAVNV